MSGWEVTHFSTASYRPHERAAACSEVFGQHCGVRIDVDPRATHGFQASAKLARTSTFGLVEGSISPIRQRNSRGSIVTDGITFSMAMTCRWNMSQLGRNADLHPGDGVLLSNSDVGAITIPEECRHLGFLVPRSAIMPLVPDIGAMFARRIPPSSPAFQMLLRYIELARRENIVTTPELAAAFTNHVCDLLALTLGPTRDAAELAKMRGLPAARLQAMKEDIRKNFGRPNLSVHSIAAQHGVSARYVQRLFEESGCTFTQFVMEQRLTAAHEALTTRSNLPVHTIAYEAGFNDVSYFNRAFRRRFGCTPSDVQKIASRIVKDSG